MRTTPLPVCHISAGVPVLVGASAGHFWFSDLKRMASGRILCCVGTLPDKPADPGHSARVLFSDDRGQTWREHPEQIIPGASNISLPDGRLLILPARVKPVSPGGRREARGEGAILREAPDGGLSVEATEITFRGFPFDLEHNHLSGAIMFRLAVCSNALPLNDGRLLITPYGRIAGEDKVNIFAMTSDDGGFSWQYLSTVATWRDYSESDWPLSIGTQYVGPNESNTVRLSDGRIMCVFRVGTRVPYGRSYSSDDGLTWSRPDRVDGPWSVMPRMVRLENGLIALVGGREGILVWLSPDGDSWEQCNLAAHHNAAFPDASLHYSDRVLQMQQRGPLHETTSYNGIVALGPDELLVSYDRLGNGLDGSPGPNGPVDAVFAVRVKAERR